MEHNEHINPTVNQLQGQVTALKALLIHTIIGFSDSNPDTIKRVLNTFPDSHPDEIFLSDSVRFMHLTIEDCRQHLLVYLD